MGKLHLGERSQRMDAKFQQKFIYLEGLKLLVSRPWRQQKVASISLKSRIHPTTIGSLEFPIASSSFSPAFVYSFDTVPSHKLRITSRFESRKLSLGRTNWRQSGLTSTFRPFQRPFESAIILKACFKASRPLNSH